MARKTAVGLTLAVIAAAAVFAWVVWFDREDCGRMAHYQVGIGVDTPEHALRDFGIDSAAVQLVDSTNRTRTYVDGTREIEVSFVEPGWAVTTDSTVCDDSQTGAIVIEVSGDQTQATDFRFGVRLTTANDLIADRVWADFEHYGTTHSTQVEVPAGLVFLNGLTPFGPGSGCTTEVQVDAGSSVKAGLDWESGCLEVAG